MRWRSSPSAVAAGGEQLQRVLVLLERGGEVALLVEDHPALGAQAAAHALRKRRLGHVEDLQGVLQLALEGDDQRQGDGDVRRHDGVVQLDRRLPRPLERRAGGVQLTELALRHPDRPHGDRPVTWRRVGVEHAPVPARSPLRGCAGHRRGAARGRRARRSPRPTLFGEGARARATSCVAMSSWSDGTPWDFDGPVGGYEPAFARRRIAVGADDAGRPFLLRPNSRRVRDPEGAATSGPRVRQRQVGDGRPDGAHGRGRRLADERTRRRAHPRPVSRARPRPMVDARGP